MIIEEVNAKTILSRSGIYGVDYSINPYIGCAHACAYCYARFTILKNNDPRDWGKFVKVKINAPRLLKKELSSAKRGLILLSSVTDPYQYIEKKYEITRKLLEIILKKQFPVVILTKSPLVTRDIDLFKRFRDIEVGLTITTLNEEIRKVFEHNAPSIEARLNALKEIIDAGVRNYAFIAPLLPLIDLDELDELINKLISINVDRIMVDKLNIKARNWITINEALNEYLIDMRGEFWRKAKSPYYWDKIKKYLVLKAKRAGVQIDILF